MSHTSLSGRWRSFAIATLVVLVLSLAATSAIDAVAASSARRASPSPSPNGGGGYGGPRGPAAGPGPQTPTGVRLGVSGITVPVLTVDSEGANETAATVRVLVFRLQASGERAAFALLSARDVPVPRNADPQLYYDKVERKADVDNARALSIGLVRAGLGQREAANEAVAAASAIREELEARVLSADDPVSVSCGGETSATSCPALATLLESLNRARA